MVFLPAEIETELAKETVKILLISWLRLYILRIFY